MAISPVGAGNPTYDRFLNPALERVRQGAGAERTKKWSRGCET